MATNALKLRFVIDKKFRRDFDALEQKIQTKIVRAAIRAAVQPIETNLKAEVLANAEFDRMQMNKNGSFSRLAPQSTGAMFRAVKSKVSKSRRSIYRFYGVIGVDKAHLEYLNSNTRPDASTNGRYQQIYTGRIRGLAKHGRISYYKSKRAQPREVKAMSRRKFGTRVESIRNKNRRKRPGNYWHIFLRGATGIDTRGPWAGKRQHRWAGNDILQKVIDRHRASTLFIFRQKILEGLSK
jgi:hypothetical protein